MMENSSMYEIEGPLTFSKEGKLPLTALQYKKVFT